MIRYRLLTTGGTYGVEARQADAVVRYEDVTEDREAMERLVDRCNREALSLCHLEDVLEDYLTDFRL